MSKAGSDKALDTMDELLEMLGRLEPDIGCEDAGGASTGGGNHGKEDAVGNTEGEHVSQCDNEEHVAVHS